MLKRGVAPHRPDRPAETLDCARRALNAPLLLVTSGPAVSSITVDLLVVAVAGGVFIVVEARRLGMRRAWLYIVLSGLTAFAFTFPLFLAMRQRRLTALARIPGSAPMTG